ELARWLEQARDWRVRANAALALEGRSRDPVALEALLEALDNTSVHVRQSAGAALAAERQPAPVVEAILARIDEDPDDWRSAGPLLSVLARSGRGGDVLAWADRWPLDAVGPWTRISEALMTVAGDAALARLVRAAGSESPPVASAALRALATRWPAERRRPGSHEAYWQAFSRAAGSADAVGLPVVAPVLADPVFVARGSVPLLVGAWERLASQGDADAAAAVLAALGETGAPEADPTLREALAHPDPRLADAAAEALIALAGDGTDGSPADTAGAANGTARRSTRGSAREREVDWAFLGEMGPRPRLVLETDEGRVVVALVPEEAPVTVQTVARLAVEGRYDGVPFHRVIPTFVVQGGDVSRGDGTGGPGFSIPSELTSLRFLRGTAGMASAGKDTEGSQFFLTHSPQPHLDGGYTAFGWVVEGMDVVDRLVEGQRILRASVERGG
ncbi:MAG: peptidylprolyl isomerase, partial [Gemmatimonadetes bacterium]|nr:peptidylprolyl isomerase [Gemmatimonadota bacterium]